MEEQIQELQRQTLIKSFEIMLRKYTQIMDKALDNFCELKKIKNHFSYGAMTTHRDWVIFGLGYTLDKNYFQEILIPYYWAWSTEERLKSAISTLEINMPDFAEEIK